jgi:hypothetical protein
LIRNISIKMSLLYVCKVLIALASYKRQRNGMLQRKGKWRDRETERCRDETEI